MLFGCIEFKTNFYFFIKFKQYFKYFYVSILIHIKTILKRFKMLIAITNFKGGVGKSMIAHQLITTYGFIGYEVDPYGSLSDRLPDNVTKLNTTDKMPDITGDVIFDFGGFDSKLLREVAAKSDLVVVPFIPTLETIQATLDTLNVLKELDKPILLVANLVKKQSDVLEAKKIFDDFFGFEVEITELADSVALQSAIADNISVVDMARQGGLKAFTYKKAANSIANLKSKIDSYIII
jgi:chromosome partitioning protein